MVHKTTMPKADAQLNVYHVDYRPSADGPSLTAVDAYRVEGWREDYAFFGNARDLSEATVLIPRALVFQVRKVCNATEPPAKAARQVEYWVSVSSLDQTNGSFEGPFQSRREAEEYGERQGGLGLVWNVVTK
jgi:hypothetical protein